MTTAVKNPLQKWEGKVIPFSQMSKLPQRDSFLNADAIRRQDAVMAGGSDLFFLPVNVYEGYLPETIDSKTGTGVFTPENKYSIRSYKLFLFGVLRCGRAVTVILNGIQPYFEVRVPAGMDPRVFEQSLLHICSGAGYKVARSVIVEGGTFREFGDRPSIVQLYFTSERKRKEAIAVVRGRQYETYHDDPTGYNKVVCRDVRGTTTCWAILRGYTVKRNHPWVASQLTIELDYRGWSTYTGDILQDPELRNDLTIAATWDCETDDPFAEQKGEVPQPESPTFEMFCICVNYSFIDSEIMPPDKSESEFTYPKPRGYLALYTITTDISRARPGRVTILVDGHKEAVQAMALLHRLMRPQYKVDFNGSNYDWRCFVHLAWQLGQLQFLERNMSMLRLDRIEQFEDKPWRKPPSPLKYWWYKKYVCKLSPELSVDGRTLNYPGYQCIDMMPQLRCINNNPERYSLNTFLGMYKLGAKVDMPYTRMFAIHRLTKQMVAASGADRYPVAMREDICRVWMHLHGLSRQFEDLLRWNSDINEYCTFDAAKCQDLMQKSVFIRDRREIGLLSYTCMEDCVNRANGMKVRNLTIGRAATRGIHISNIAPEHVEPGKYPGALVIDPKKGIKAPRISPTVAREEAIRGNENYKQYRDIPDDLLQKLKDFIWEYGIHWRRFSTATRDLCRSLFPPQLVAWFELPHHYPIGGLDFSSLYPSLIMAYNYSPEKMLHSLQRALEVAKAGYKIHPVSFPFNGRTIVGWSVRHKYHSCECKACSSGKPTADCLRENVRRMNDPSTDFGIFPTILKELFDARVQLKAQLKPVAARKEKIELMKREEFERPEIAAEYSEVCFAFNYLNSKQKALKVFMNTFYGESGNARSPLRVLALAGGVTTSGQYNLRLASKYIESIGNEVHYGDTDSLYNSPGPEWFDLVDREYYSGRITLGEYMKRVVEIAFVQIEKARKGVNAEFVRDSGTEFLSMAYEEILYPTVLFAKKNYMGIPHIGHFNADPKEIFLKGGETVKKGASQLMIKSCKELMWRFLDPQNHQDPVTLVTRKIQDIFTSKHDFREFIKTATYKPLKQNITVQTFARIMKERGTPIEPLSRFSYVLVKKNPYKYDVRGRKTELSVGERMELAEVAEREGMPIDLSYYMSSNVCGQLARFIAFMPQFAVDVKSSDDYDEAEAKSMKAALAYVNAQCDKYAETPKSRGPMYQQLFKHVNAAFSSGFGRLGTGTGAGEGSSGDVLQMLWIEHKAPRGASKEKWEENNGLYDMLLEKIDKSAAREATADAKALFRRMFPGGGGAVRRGAGAVDRKAANDAEYDRAMSTKAVYTALLRERREHFARDRNALLVRIRNSANALNTLMQKRNAVIEQCTSAIKQALNLENVEFEEKDWASRYINPEGLSKMIQATIMKTWNSADIRTLGRIQRLASAIRSRYKIIYQTDAFLGLVSSHAKALCGDTSVSVKKSEVEAEALAYFRSV